MTDKQPMTRPALPSLRWRGLLAATLLLGSTAGLAQVFVDLTVDDIKGTPAKVAMRQGKKKVERSQRRYVAARQQRTRQVAQARTTTKTQLAKLPPATTRKQETRVATVTRNNRPTQIRVTETVVETPYQNVVLAFVNPKGGMVANLKVSATVQTKDGKTTVLDNLATDEQGKVKLNRVGPLPASVDLEVTGSDATNAVVANEWQFADVRNVSFTIDKGLGTKVATNVMPAPYQVASADNMTIQEQKIVNRTVVYEYQMPQPVVVERTVVDVQIAAPAGSKVTSAALPEKEFVVPESGSVTCQIPAAALADGPVPVRVAQPLGAGEAEAVITDYPTDPYTKNEAPTPTPSLVRLTKWDVSGGVGVLATADDVKKALGEPKKSGGSQRKLKDGSEWWEYPRQGLAYKIRRAPDDKKPAIVERVRIIGDKGGKIGGITAGSDGATVVEALGKPQADAPARRLEVDPAAGATIDAYMDNGVRVCQQSGKVQWVEIARPADLLSQGTTAFVPRTPARLYVESFQGNEKTGLTDERVLAAFLEQLPSVRLTDKKEQADLILKAQVTDFSEKRDQIVFEFLPFKYSCETKLTYSLYDVEKDQYVVQDKPVSASAKVDYTKEVAIGATAIGFLMTRKDDGLRMLGLLLGAGGIQQLQRSVARGVNRCPAIASKTVFNAMVTDINRNADFTVRVTDIDYEKNCIRLNAGTRAGIAVSTPEKPSEFEVIINGEALPGSEAGLSADYYTAVVVEADENSSLCELRQIKRRVDKSTEKIEQKAAPWMITRIPDPTTALVSARAAVRFPSIPVVPEEAPKKTGEKTGESSDANTGSSTGNNGGGTDTATLPITTATTTRRTATAAKPSVPRPVKGLPERRTVAAR
jgi:hypothetical protein